MNAFLAGLGLGYSLIIAIGAQNMFVLRQGIRRERQLLVAAICTLSDMALIVIGISGIGAATTALPWLVTAVRWAGAIFLVCYGTLAARRALRPSGEVLVVSSGDDSAPAAAGAGTATLTATGASVTTLGSIVATTLALTWLNPHVYLDTVFLLGSVGAAHGDQRWVFAGGAMLASLTWFFGLASAGRFLSGWLASVRAWRILDAAIAVVMVVLGISLVWPVG